MITYLNKLLKETKKELKGFFIEREAYALIAIFTSSQIETILEYITDSKSYLINQVNSAIKWGELIDFEDVASTLVGKLNKLTEFQSFVVYRMVVEYWNWSEDNICNCLNKGRG